MKDNTRYLTRMTLFLAAVLAPVAVFYPVLLDAFLANPALNGLIVGVLIIGIALNYRQVILLGPESKWLEHFQSSGSEDNTETLGDDRPGATSAEDDAPPTPRLLAPMARMLRDAKGRTRFSLSALAMRSLLDSISTRLDEARELSRYLIGLSIFLGLLGTFWGLLATVASISDVIGGLSIAGEDIAIVFNELKSGLEAPLSGMGTAFSSSLFGLAGSLILGFMDLQAGQAQNAFYNDLEEWLSGVTHLSSGSVGGGEDSGPGMSAYTEALLEQTSDGLDDLQKLLVRAENSRADSAAQMAEFNSNLMTLNDLMRAEQKVLTKLAESQIELRNTLNQMTASAGETATGGRDDASRHMRNIESLLGQMAADLRAGRDEVSRDIRKEIKILARTLAASTGSSDPDSGQSDGS